MKGSFEDNLDQLQLNSGFAFFHDESEYYFASKWQREGKLDCHYFVGFKDKELRYSFPYSVFNDLNKIYESKLSAPERIAIAVKTFEGYKSLEIPRACFARRKNELMENILTFLVYSPALAVVFPTILIEELKEKIYDADEIRLGMSFARVRKLLGNRPFYVRKEMGETFHVYDQNQYRLVMYFKNGRLHAWVRGRKYE